MRALRVLGAGDATRLEVAETADPVPAAGEMLISVAAAGVNRADLLQRRGLYPPPPGASDILGLEVAGRVRALGPGVVGWRVGDRAMALLAGGGYAEQVAVPADHALPVPEGLSLMEAAAVPEAFLTAAHTLRLLAPVGSGDRLLVHAAASGVGTAAVQMGLALGATVAGTVRTPAKTGTVERLGGRPVVVESDGTDLAEAVRTALGGGATVVLDLVGASYWPATLASLDEDGTISVVGLMGGARATVDLSALMRRRTRIVAAALRPLPSARKAALVEDFRAWGLPLLEAGALSPCLDRTFPLEDADAAHRALESNETVGKLVLRVDEV